MNNTTRLLVVTLSNFILVSLILFRASALGIDLEHSTLVDNANNIRFMFDFVSFLIVMFFINALALSIPSKRARALRRIIKNLDIKETHTNNRYKKQSV